MRISSASWQCLQAPPRNNETNSCTNGFATSKQEREKQSGTVNQNMLCPVIFKLGSMSERKPVSAPANMPLLCLLLSQQSKAVLHALVNSICRSTRSRTICVPRLMCTSYSTENVPIVVQNIACPSIRIVASKVMYCYSTKYAQ